MGQARPLRCIFPRFLDEIKAIGSPFYANEGTNTRSWVHIEDLMQIYAKLVEAAAAGGGNADWGVEVRPSENHFLSLLCADIQSQGYYLGASQEHSQIDVAKKTGEILAKHGLIAQDKAAPVQLPVDRINEMMQSYNFPGIGTYMFAANSRTRAERAQETFGYEPRAPGLWEVIEAEVLAAAGKA